MSILDKRECAGAGLAAGSDLLVGGSVAASSLLADYPVVSVLRDGGGIVE